MKRAPNKRNKKMEINIVKTDAPGFVELNFSMKIALKKRQRSNKCNDNGVCSC